MPDLIESGAAFPAGVTRIETTEPVIGGEAGVANRALKQLGSRTLWLKAQIEAVLASLSTVYARRDGDYTTLRARATTKADVGLGAVPNYPATNDASGGSTVQLATAAAVQAALGGVVAPPTNLAVGGTGDARTITSSTGADASLPLASTLAAGLMSSADKGKLNGVAPGAQVNVGTDLGVVRTATSVSITSSTGSNAGLVFASDTLAGVMRAADKAKLDGIAAGADVSPATTALRTSSSATTVLQAKAMNDHRMSGDHDARYAAIADGWPGVYDGSAADNLIFPVGAAVLCVNTGGAAPARNALVTLRLSAGASYTTEGAGSLLAGAWRARGALIANNDWAFIAERVS